MKEEVLPEFQKYLLTRKLVKEKKVPFYAYWASKFLSFSNNNEEIGVELRVNKFLDRLKKQKNISDWQIQQADEALRLYIGNFLNGDTSILYPDTKQNKKNLPDISKIMSEMRQAIRVKHYSYRTEQSYLDWAKRFYDYTLNVKKKDVHIKGLDSADVKDYLSYLALKKRVSASTQNQAFNALQAFSGQQSAIS